MHEIMPVKLAASLSACSVYEVGYCPRPYNTCDNKRDRML